jgi:hypothetical protein
MRSRRYNKIAKHSSEVPDSVESTPARKKDDKSVQETAIYTDSEEEKAFESFDCPHCSKSFKQKGRFDAHVKKRTCRKDSTEKDRPKTPERSPADGSEYAETPTLRKRPQRTRTPVSRYQPDVKVQSDTDESGGEDDSDEDGSSVAESSAADHRRKRKHAKKSVDPGDLQCPHCKKQLKNPNGLQYHLDNFVCRPDLRSPMQGQKGKRKSEKTDSGYRKIRGELEDRTCPLCKRVFTSILGRNYHVDKKVCEAKKQNKNTVGPNPVLKPGQRFATKFGVVQVLNDSRAKPTAVYSDNFQTESKNYARVKGVYDVRQKNLQKVNTIKHYAKRSRLSTLFEAGKITQQSVFLTSLGVEDPLQLSLKEQSHSAPSSILRPNPSEPEDSYPSRIVECIVIADKRQRFLGDTSEPSSVKPHGFVSCKMFLQRRLLTQPYYEHLELYCCQHCGQEFTSRLGVKHHLQTQGCLMKKQKLRNASEKFLETLIRGQEFPSDEHNMEEESSEIDKALNSNGLLKTPVIKKRVYKRKKEKSVANVSVYPQVILALGFKLLPRSIMPTKTGAISAFTDPLPPVDEHSESDTEAATKRPRIDPPQRKDVKMKTKQPDVIDPRNVLADLTTALNIEQAKFLGPVYSFVFDSLGFEKPGKKSSKEKKKPKQKAKTKTKPRPTKKAVTSKVKPVRAKRPPSRVQPAPHNHRFLHIDMRVLVDEALTGRYPSVKRNGPDTVHEQACYICNGDAPALLECQFCNKSIHFKCMLTRYIVKEPDIEDDFMCSNCINYLHHRRKRAEKRRLDKLGVSKETEDASNMELLMTVVKGKEQKCLSVQGRQVAEIMELVSDCRSRLIQSVGVRKLDQLRCAMLASCEDESSFLPSAHDDDD